MHCIADYLDGVWVSGWNDVAWWLAFCLMCLVGMEIVISGYCHV